MSFKLCLSWFKIKICKTICICFSVGINIRKTGIAPHITGGENAYISNFTPFFILYFLVAFLSDPLCEFQKIWMTSSSYIRNGKRNQYNTAKRKIPWKENEKGRNIERKNLFLNQRLQIKFKAVLNHFPQHKNINRPQFKHVH